MHDRERERGRRCKIERGREGDSAARRLNLPETGSKIIARGKTTVYNMYIVYTYKKSQILGGSSARQESVDS